MKRRCTRKALWMLWFVLAPLLCTGFAAEDGPQAQGVPVRLENAVLFHIRHDLGPLDARARAEAVEEALFDLATNPFRPAGEYGLREVGSRTDLVYGDRLITTVTDEDAASEGLARAELAAQRLDLIQREVELHRGTLWHPRPFLLGLLYTLLFTVPFLIASRLLFRRLARTIKALEGGVAPSKPLAILAWAERLPGLDVRRQLARLLRTVRNLLFLAALVAYFTVTMSFFPRSSHITQAFLDHLLTALATVWVGFAGYLPKLLFVVIIVILTYYASRVARLFFAGVAHGSISLPGFDPDWAEPTARIVGFFLVALAGIMVYPYLPGSQSEAFQAVSLFLGLLISLSSSSAISNVIAGTILTYTSAFKIGDRVKVSDTVGDVISKSLLVTHVRTVKNVDVAIPNSLVLANHIVNFSKEARSMGLILNTTVTIGYDAPWRTIHELLIAAALETREVLDDPRPFVLQKSLDDFYVSYELNAYTRNPWRMAVIYSELHQNIQDRFNEAGVEIMSPHFSSLRDGNRIAIPDQYVPGDYRDPAFRIVRSAQHGEARAVADDHT